MKRFVLLDKSDPDPGPGKEGLKFDYTGILDLVVKSPLDPQRGIGLDEQRKSIRLLDALDGKKPGDTLELEDADWQLLVDKLKAHQWGLVDRRIPELVDYVTSATDKLPDEAAPATDVEATPAPSGEVDAAESTG